MCKSDEAIFAAVVTNDDEIYLGRVSTASVGGKAGVEVTLPGRNGQPGETHFLPVRCLDLIRPFADQGELASAIGRVADAEGFGLELDAVRRDARRADERCAGSAGDLLRGEADASSEDEVAAVVRAAGAGDRDHSYVGWLATAPCAWLPGFLALRIPAAAGVPCRRILLNPAAVHSIRLVQAADLPALATGFATPDDVDEYLSYCDAAEPLEMGCLRAPQN